MAHKFKDAVLKRVVSFLRISHLIDLWRDFHIKENVSHKIGYKSVHAQNFVISTCFRENGVQTEGYNFLHFSG